MPYRHRVCASFFSYDFSYLRSLHGLLGVADMLGQRLNDKRLISLAGALRAYRAMVV